MFLAGNSTTPLTFTIIPNVWVLTAAQLGTIVKKTSSAVQAAPCALCKTYRRERKKEQVTKVEMHTADVKVKVRIMFNLETRDLVGIFPDQISSSPTKKELVRSSGGACCIFV